MSAAPPPRCACGHHAGMHQLTAPAGERRCVHDPRRCQCPNYTPAEHTR